MLEQNRFILQVAAPTPVTNLQRTFLPLLVALAVVTSGTALAQTTEPILVAQGTTTTPAREQIQRLRSRLNTLREQKQDFGDVYRGSPGITIANPSGFGADNNTIFVSASYQTRIRPSNNDADGGVGVGVGLFDAQKAVGLELSYAFASFGRTRPFGSGAFNAKVHRRFEDDLAVAIGWNGFANVGQTFNTPGFTNDFDSSVYLAVSKIIKTQEDIAPPFSRIALTGGVGTGQFRSVPDIVAQRGTVGVFGTIAARIAEPVSLIAEWTGQDLALGLSIAPFPNLGLVITPAVRDIAGAQLNGARFVLGTGFSFKF